MMNDFAKLVHVLDELHIPYKINKKSIILEDSVELIFTEVGDFVEAKTVS